MEHQLFRTVFLFDNLFVGFGSRRNPQVHTGQMQIKTRSELEQLGNALLEPLFPVTKGVRLLGLSLSSLEAEEAERERQVSLSL